MSALSRLPCVVVALMVAGNASASQCFDGVLLEKVDTDKFVAVCTDSGGAQACWEPPSGACALDNTVTVEVDGQVISNVTYPGSGGGEENVCSNSFDVVSHYFTIPGIHHVTETTTAPPSVDDFTVTVVPGPLCDVDGDGVMDAVDNCMIVPNADQKDTDLDGDGDACDKDDDDDLCPDDTDPDDQDGTEVIGSRLLINCPQSRADVTQWGGTDQNMNGVPTCADPDDDGDGIPDDEDPCPAHHAKLGERACEFPPYSCPVQPWWDVCLLGGGCQELLVRITSVINPDPTLEVFTEIDIVGQALVLSPQSGLSLDKMRATLLGEGQRDTRFRLEVWSKGRSGEPVAHVATIGEYDARNVASREGVGNALVLGFDERGSLESIQQVSH